MERIMETTIVYWGTIGIMDNKMSVFDPRLSATAPQSGCTLTWLLAPSWLTCVTHMTPDVQVLARQAACTYEVGDWWVDVGWYRIVQKYCIRMLVSQNKRAPI